MIRRSTAIAAAATVLSLLVHFLGLSFTSHTQPDRPAEDGTTDEIVLGNAFEDFAEPLSQPVPPEAAPIPDPPVKTPPEPDLAETPTSEALVASDNPQRVLSPDTGRARAVQPDTTEPIEPEVAAAPAPRPVAPSGGDAEATVTPPVEPDTDADPPGGNPDTATKDVVAETAPKPTTTPAPRPDVAQQPIALMSPLVPARPVRPTPEPSALQVIPLDRETIAPEPPVTTGEPADPETVPGEDRTDGSGSAVVASLRPQLPTRRPSAERNGSTEFAELLFPSLVESPLTAYQRGQADPFAGQNGGTQAGGLSFLESRGPGNSDVTNYAGRVLVQLNRAPAVRVAGRGSARVYFEINPDGTLARVDIIESTGSREFDRAAMAQVRSAAPFPPPPKGASRKLAFVYRNN